MIYTTYYANLRSVPAGAEVYAISNGCPSGVSIPKLWQAVPAWSAVQQYKQTGDWESFKASYLKLLEVRDSSAWAGLVGSDKDIFLVCYEKDPSVCHRSILAEWLGKRHGLVVKEWRGEM